MGGNATVNLLRGPMHLGDGRDIKDRKLSQCRMNFAGRSKETRRKKKSGHTTQSGMVKELSLAHYKLSTTDESLLVSNELVDVIPCVLSNDGNPLKPAIEFDNHFKRNIGLDIVVDYDFTQKNPSPNPEFLKNHIVTEAVISSVTTLKNKTSMPTIAEYVPKTGKTGANLTSSFMKNIILLQTCERCQKMTRDHEHIISDKDLNCHSTCNECLDQKQVCEDCLQIGHQYYLPCLRACEKCLKAGQRCTRRIILVLCSDCEEGNKKAFKMIIDMISDGTIDPHLFFLVILPDAIHVGKSLKQGFANWMLVLGNERGCLGILRALRSRSSKEVTTKMHQLLPKSDYVVNRDRMDPSAVIALTRNAVTDYLSSVGYLSVTIIPEMCKFTEDNRVGFYPKPVDVCVGPFGKILALYNYNEQDGTSNLLSARLHCPVDQLQILRKKVSASQIYYDDGIAFLCGRSGKITAIECRAERIHVKSNKNRTKAGYISMLERLGLSKTGTAKKLKARLIKHIGQIQSNYDANQIDRETIQLEQVLAFESIYPMPGQSCLIAASSSHHSIFKLLLKFDGVGIQAMATHCFDYDENWSMVRSVCFASSSIFVSHATGISKAISLDDESYCPELEMKNDSDFNAFKLAAYKSGLLITDIINRKIWVYDPHDENTLKEFAASGECRHREGPVLNASFCKPCGLSVEFDNVVYVCDIDANRINIVTSLTETGKFLNSVGKVYDAFSVHSKGKNYSLKSLDVAIEMTNECSVFLKEKENQIRCSTDEKLPSTLNGTHGFVASKTTESVDIIVSGLRRLEKIKHDFSYTDVNLLSCLTIDVEHFHAATHFKSVTMSMQQYCVQFASTLRESIKRITKWGVHYYTGAESWYPTPDNSPSLEEVPTMIKGSGVKMDLRKTEEMRTWAHVFGRAVRQKTNRQQTTMASAGTLPSYVYDVRDQQSENSVSLF